MMMMERETISPEIVYPELRTTQRLDSSGKDYNIWKLKINFILINKGISHVLHNPEPPDEPATHDLHQKWRRDDAMCRCLIRQSVTEGFYLSSDSTAKSMLDYLEKIYNSTLIQRWMNLWYKYVRLRMSEDTCIGKHVLDMWAAAYEIEMAGLKVPDEIQALVFMNSLPQSWNGVVRLLNSQLTKDIELGFDDVSQRLRIEAEARLQRSGGGGDNNNVGFKRYCCLCRQLGHNLLKCPQEPRAEKNHNSGNNYPFSEEDMNIFEASYYEIKTAERLSYAGTNYRFWKYKLSAVLGCFGLDYVLTDPKPSEPMDSTPEVEVNSYKKWLADDFTCRNLILGAMEDNLLIKFHNQPTAKALMDALDAWFNFPSLARRMALFRQYVEWTMSDDTDVHDHIYSNMNRMVGELERAGIVVPHEIQGVVLMNSLPRSWEDTRITMTLRIDKEIQEGKDLLKSVTECVRDVGHIRGRLHSSNNNNQGKSSKRYKGRY